MKTLAMMFLAAACISAIACEPSEPLWPDNGAQQPITSEPEPAPAAAQAEPVMAYVNGKAIYMREINRVLVTNFGLPIAQQLITDELLAQQAKREGIEVTGKDVEDENDRALATVAPERITDPAQREAVLNQLLQQKGITHERWRAAMRRGATLRKLATKQVQITEADLHDEYERQFGRRVQVRHMEVESLAAAQQILQNVQDGRAFVELVREYSLNPSRTNDGLLPPLNLKTVDIPPAIREAAVALETVGETSQPIRVGKHYHLLQLVKAYEPEEADFEVVKNDLRRAAREFQIRTIAQTILADLRRNAKIEIVDPILRRQLSPAEAR